MFDRLEDLVKRLEEVMEELSEPDVVNDQARFRNLMKEQNELTPIVEKYNEYKDAKQTIEDSVEMLEAENDEEMREMLKEELSDAKAAEARCEEELKILLLPKDPNDDKNVIVEIRAGAGGDEAALFAAEIYRMYKSYAESKRWKTEFIDVNENGIGGFKEVSFMINGQGAYSVMKYESGVHRVQRVPETEASGRIHTSTVTVAVLPEVEDVEVEINPADLQIDTYRSSGAGGQHINKTSSAVRITHLPTGIVVQCQNERSQHHNKDKAMQMLKAKLYLMMEQEQAEKMSGIRGEVKDIGFGNQIRSYVMHPYSLVKDHRTNEETSNVGAVMDGEIDRFINAYLKQESANG